MRRRAFTLIELLIVVAIIAILAAIAVPNFLEAQTRAKVSRAKADMRSLTTGMEAYYIDHNRYPPVFTTMVPAWFTTTGVGRSVFKSGQDGVSARFIPLTTPIAYITSVFAEPFAVNGVAAGTFPQQVYDTFDYVQAAEFQPGTGFGAGQGSALTSGGAWRIASVGPDRYAAFGGRSTMDGAGHLSNINGANYDPTNGTVSVGDIVRVGSSAPYPSGNPPFYDRASGPYAN